MRMFPCFWALHVCIYGCDLSECIGVQLWRESASTLICMCVSCMRPYITSVPLLCCCLPLSLCSVIDPDKLLSELLILWSESLMLSPRAGLTCRQHRRLPSEVTTAQTHKYTCIFMYTYVHIHTADTADTGRRGGPSSWLVRQSCRLHAASHLQI